MNNDYNEKDESNFHNFSEENKITSFNNDLNLYDEENENIEAKENKNENLIADEIKDYNNKELNTKINLDGLIEEEDNHSNEQEEEELPLITLNFISVCQCCKNRFDKNEYLPYLLKCGHFFCLSCINQYFTEERGIVCPSDGLVAKSVKELKLLKNLIINPDKKKKTEKIKKIKTKDKINPNNYENSDYYNYMKNNLENYNRENNTNYKMNYCRIHKNQKLSHIICDTNEIICVHCAFEMLKLNPSMQIKELKEKYNDLNDFISEIMNNSQKNIDLIQNTIELIKKNRENEQKKIKRFYNNLIKFLENEKKEKN